MQFAEVDCDSLVEHGNVSVVVRGCVLVTRDDVAPVSVEELRECGDDTLLIRARHEHVSDVRVVPKLTVVVELLRAIFLLVDVERGPTAAIRYDRRVACCELTLPRNPKVRGN